MDAVRLEQHDRFLGEYFRNSTVLISGATGLIGSHAAAYLDRLNRLQNANIRIVALYRSEEKRAALAAQLHCPQQVCFVQCDVEQGVPYAEAVDYVIHCAGYSGGTKMHLKDPVKVFDTGIGGTRALLDLAAACGCKGFLYVSTYEVYGEQNGEERIRENDPVRLDTFALRNCYAEIKRLCEALLCAFSAKYGLNTYAVRLTSTFGSGVGYNDPRFFAEFARCIVENRDIVLKSHGATVRSYLDADDAAIAFLYVLAKGRSCTAYNLTNMENEISILEIAKRMIALQASPIAIRIEGAEDVSGTGMRKEGKTVMDAAAIEALGWKPVWPLDDTLNKLVETFRRHKCSESEASV